MKIVIEVIEENLSEAEELELVRQFARDTPDAKDGGYLELTDDIGRALLVNIVGIMEERTEENLGTFTVIKTLDD